MRKTVEISFRAMAILRPTKSNSTNVRNRREDREITEVPEQKEKEEKKSIPRLVEFCSGEKLSKTQVPKYTYSILNILIVLAFK